MHRLLLLACLAVTSCAESAAGPGDDLRGDWQVTAMTRDGEAVPLPDGVEGTLVVDRGRLGGTSFCNSFGADYRLEGGLLRIEELLTSTVACTADVGRAESVYLGALNGGRVRVLLDGDDLVMAAEGVRLRFRSRESATPTRWCPAACS